MSQPNIKFRVITLNSKEDIEKHTDILQKTGDVLLSSGLISASSNFINLVKTDVIFEPRIFLLFDKGQLVSAGWGREENSFKNTFSLLEIGTRKEHQGKKYGTRLMAEIVNYVLLKKKYRCINMTSAKGTQIINRRIFEKSKRYNFEEWDLNAGYKTQKISGKRDLKVKLK